MDSDDDEVRFLPRRHTSSSSSSSCHPESSLSSSSHIVVFEMAPVPIVSTVTDATRKSTLPCLPTTTTATKDECVKISPDELALLESLVWSQPSSSLSSSAASSGNEKEQPEEKACNGCSGVEQEMARNQRVLHVLKYVRDVARIVEAYGKSDAFEFTETQMRALYLFETGVSFFMTGPPGAGKSRLIHEMIARGKKMSKRMAVTAMTGLPADMIGGTTLHSFAGLQLGDKPVDYYIQRFMRYDPNGEDPKSPSHRWQKTDVLIVDEISMCAPDYFHKLDSTARALRRCPAKPFGGMQLVVSGDFFQLPYVQKRAEKDYDDPRLQLPGETKQQYLSRQYLFESCSWHGTIKQIVMLDQVFRQKEPEFVDRLARVRVGELNEDDHKWFNSRVRTGRSVVGCDGLETTWLFAHRKPSEERNKQCLAKLPGRMMRCERIVSHARKRAGKDEPLMTRLEDVQNPDVRDRMETYKKQRQRDTAFDFKVGMRVLSLQNITGTNIRNGTNGIVLDVGDKPLDEVGVPGKDGKVGTGRLGRAPDECIWVQFSTYSAPGAPMVHALLPIKRCERKEALRSDEAMKSESMWTEWISDSYIELIGGYAMTSHRVQGQQLATAHIELDESMFEAGQAYTAISRVMSQAGLTLTRYDPRAFIVNPDVVDFYRTCERSIARRKILDRQRAALLADVAMRSDRVIVNGRDVGKRLDGLHGRDVGHLLFIVFEMMGSFTVDHEGLRRTFRNRASKYENTRTMAYVL